MRGLAAVKTEMRSLSAQIEAAADLGRPLRQLESFRKMWPSTQGDLAAANVNRSLASNAHDAAPLKRLAEAFRVAIPSDRITEAVALIGHAQVQSAIRDGVLARAAGGSAVADQMASLAAAALGGHLARTAESGHAALTPWAPPMARRIREWTEARANALNQLFHGVATQIDTAEQRLPELVLRTGWVIPVMEETPAFLVQLGDLNGRTLASARRALGDIYRPGRRRFVRVTTGLRESAVLSRHRRALDQGLSALRRGHNYSAVCTLLPLVEGALHAVDWARAPENEPQSISAAWHAVRGERDALWLTLLDVVLSGQQPTEHALNRKFTRSEVAENHDTNRALHRNAILHGASSAYGTRENAVRLVLLLAAIVEIRPPVAPS